VKARALKWTRQREAILEAFLTRTGHFTNDEIRAAAARIDPTVGLATVYRTLRLFADAGIATERRFQDGLTRYEVRQPHHDHLICVDCGTIVEFEHDEIERLQEDVARDHGFRLRSHRHELYGSCSKCTALPVAATRSAQNSGRTRPV
jgi:Fur family ferric uptake transcriptional regulator